MKRNFKNIILFSIFLLVFMHNPAAQGSQTKRLITIQRTGTEIVTDGILNVSVWQSVSVADSFINKWPVDYGMARLKTVQLWGNFDLDVNCNNIKFNNITIHPLLTGPTIEYAFSNTISWATFLQYNTQLKNFNVNSSIQWHF